MRHLTSLHPGLRLPLLVFAVAACSEDQSLTAPTAPEQAAAVLRIVNSPADPGDGTCNAAECTLREAIKDPASTEIRFAPGFIGPISLVKPLVIERPLTITGPSGGVVIRRRATDPAFRLLRVLAGGNATLTDLTLRGGRADQGAGGIVNYGTLALTRVQVHANAPNGIHNDGTLRLTASKVVGNAADGIYAANNATTTVTGGEISRNGGQGIGNAGGTLTMAGTAVSYNGGGGVAQSRGTTTLARMRIVGNAGRGVAAYNGETAITHSTIARNGGGGIYNWRGRLTLDHSTVVGNTTTAEGGGILCRAHVRASVRTWITNSTVSGNSAASGGGIFCEDATYGSAYVYLVNSTVAFNTASQAGGGIAQSAEENAWIDLVNTLVALNTAPTAPDIRANTGEYDQVSIVASLIGDGSGSGIPNEGDNQVGNVPPYTAPIDPRIGALADNGGPTRTHALLADSPALDAAEATLCPDSDQRDVARPQGAGCDIGSYERE